VGYGATVVASAVTDDALIRRVRPLVTDLCLRTVEAVTLAGHHQPGRGGRCHRQGQPPGGGPQNHGYPGLSTDGRGGKARGRTGLAGTAAAARATRAAGTSSGAGAIREATAA
jgi:hypothetical protein